MQTGPKKNRQVRRPVVVNLPAGGVAVVESQHAPQFQPTWLRHPFAKLILVIAGRGSLEANGRCWTLDPDTLLQVPADLAHRIADHPGQPMALYAVCYRDPAAPVSIQRWPLGDLARAFRADVREMLFEQAHMRVGWETILRSRLGDLLVRCQRLEQRQAKPAMGHGIDGYLARLEHQFYQQESLDDAARAAGLSRRKFTELFRHLTGQSWRQRVQALRVRHAGHLLEQTDKPVISVAFESGFDDLSTFHRVFKRAKGLSPAQYRQCQRGSAA